MTAEAPSVTTRMTARRQSDMLGMADLPLTRSNSVLTPRRPDSARGLQLTPRFLQWVTLFFLAVLFTAAVVALGGVSADRAPPVSAAWRAGVVPVPAH
jgi:hypothetical protein